MAASARHIISEAGQDWRSGAGYDALLDADVSAFAWEWMRRHAGYRQAWRHFVAPKETFRPDPCAFGLTAFEDPEKPVPLARPVWRSDILPDALTAHIASLDGPPQDRIDLRRLSPLVTIVFSGDDIEHLLLSDGRHFLRIDIICGTLIGCPAPLTYLLNGLTRLQGPIHSLRRLALLLSDGEFGDGTSGSEARQQRRILELRVADALMAGADQQSIARALFGPRIADRHWRVESAPYRRRVQRLVTTAQDRLRDPRHIWSS